VVANAVGVPRGHLLKAADLLAGPWRMKVNAATMLGQSKTCHQAEIDAACELIDFFRFNVHFMREIYAKQPPRPRACGTRWSTGARGFVFAVTPFNFTSIAGNLPTAPALDGKHGRLEAGVVSGLFGVVLMELLEARACRRA
jgi:1-pyrroline-5-carboxylate dehydrogenase